MQNQVTLAMKFDIQTGDSGVSPVVGVILMVAITVILSAIIATFVLDLGGSVSQNPSAGVTFDSVNPSGASAYVTVQAVSMENTDSLETSSTGDGNWDTTTISNVGDTATYTLDAATASNSGTITVTATLDGKTSVIQTHDYDFS